MLYTELEVGNKTYKLRLNTRNIVALEKAIGCNPLMVFGNGDKIPEITTMVQIFHNALQPLQHGITLDNAFDIFDEYLADGHSATDFINVIIEIYKVSGIIPKDAGATEEKNA